jgi:hypothetical protein
MAGSGRRENPPFHYQDSTVAKVRNYVSKIEPKTGTETNPGLEDHVVAQSPGGPLADVEGFRLFLSAHFWL